MTVSFNTGPNLENYPYRVSCYARDPLAPVTMSRCMDLPYNQDRLVAAFDGDLPMSYSTVSTVLGTQSDGIRAATAVDCFVEVAGGKYVLAPSPLP